jgi:hypothetical protein
MFTAQIDLGQVLLSLLIGVVGWFVKRTIDKFEVRLDKHENILFGVNGDIQAIIGKLEVERRRHPRN